jgi:hypothetical protein
VLEGSRHESSSEKEAKSSRRTLPVDSTATPEATLTTSKQADFSAKQQIPLSPRSSPLFSSCRTARQKAHNLSETMPPERSLQSHTPISSDPTFRTTHRGSFNHSASASLPPDDAENKKVHAGADGVSRWIGGRPASINPEKPHAHSFCRSETIKREAWDSERPSEQPRGKSHIKGHISKASNSVLADDGV